jgi:hypothetical protein
MSESRQRKHDSHLPVLELIFKHSSIKDIFEYGCGSYSTNFFVKNAKSITSVEMNREIWYNKMKSEISSDKLNLLFIKGGPDSIEYFKSTGKIYDLVFVDGDNSSRKDCTYASFGKSETVAVHDVNLTWRRWKHRGWSDFEKCVPSDYKIIVMNMDYPATTVYTKNDHLFLELQKEKSIVIRGIKNEKI